MNKNEINNFKLENGELDNVRFMRALVGCLGKMDKRELNSKTGWRHAGMLEAMFFVVGYLEIGKEINYLSGGKIYILYILDTRWTETYPEYILRMGMEFFKD